MSMQRDTRKERTVHSEVGKDAKRVVESVAKTQGMTATNLLRRLLLWFGRLDQTEQALVLGQVNVKDETGVAGILMARLQREQSEAQAEVDHETARRASPADTVSSGKGTRRRAARGAG